MMWPMRVYKRPENVVKATQAEKDAAFTPSGRAPRIVCGVCAKGPFDGVALYRLGALLRCEEHRVNLEQQTVN
jgi:hypothetical protein